jgi:hypothetical protein
VDEALKRPANNPATVELQVCRTELHNARLQSKEANRDAQAAAVTLAHQLVREQIMNSANSVDRDNGLNRVKDVDSLAESGQASTLPAQANRVHVVSFASGTANLVNPIGGSSTLVADALTAPQIVIRASRRERTSASVQTLTSARLAISRAKNVRNALLGAGIDSHRIRIEIESVEDAASTALGNQRNLQPLPIPAGQVEVEVYRALPIVSATGAGSRPAPPASSQAH